MISKSYGTQTLVFPACSWTNQSYYSQKELTEPTGDYQHTMCVWVAAQTLPTPTLLQSRGCDTDDLILTDTVCQDVLRGHIEANRTSLNCDL